MMVFIGYILSIGCLFFVMFLCVVDRVRDKNFPLWKCICSILSIFALVISVGCWFYNMGQQDGVMEYIKGKYEVELNYTIDRNGAVKDTIFIFK